MNQVIEYGYCHCGCGKKTKLITRANAKLGWVKGEPRDYMQGHVNRKHLEYLVDEKGCWVWQKYINCNNGYGVIYVDSKSARAHRVYYERYKGPVPEGLVLDHLCRNKACVNPDHLEAVTTAINTRRGDSTKLTPDQVNQIRILRKIGDLTCKEIGQRFGIGHAQVSRITTGVRWAIQQQRKEMITCQQN